MGFLTNYVKNLAVLAIGRHPCWPLLFSYYITHRCMLSCIYCSDGQGKPFKDDPVDELPTDKAKQLISILREASDTLDVTGGEPLIRLDLEEILAHAQSLGFRTVLNTKGMGLPDRPELMQLTDVLVLSVDSLDADRLVRILGGEAEAAAEILRTLEWAVEHHARFGTKLVLAAVATPGNMDDVSDILRFATEHSLGFQFSPQIVGTVIHPRLQTSERFTALGDTMIASKADGAPVLGVPQYLEGVRHVRPFDCYPLLMPTIRPDGTMYYPCLESGQAEIDLLQVGSYRRAIAIGRDRLGGMPDCQGRCHVFCHMALSLLQRHPLSAWSELKCFGGAP